MTGSQTIQFLKGLVSVDPSRMLAGIRAAVGGLRNFAAAWKETGQAAAQVARDVNTSVNRIGAVMGAMAGYVAKSGLSFLAMKESATVSFTTMLGSAEKAEAFLKDLADFAKRTPFEFPGLIEASQKFLAFGFKAEEILPTLTAVGDAVAGLGGDPEALNRIVRTLGQIQAKGKLQAEEMLQLAETGIPAWQMLADHIGTDIPAAMARVTDGAVDAQTAITALTTGMSAKFGGLMNEQSSRFSGLLSTLKDNFVQASGAIVEPLFRALGELFASLNAWAESASFNDFIRSAKQSVFELVQTAKDFTPAAMQMGRAFLDFLRPIGQFLMEHPRLVAALLALKVTGFLGLNDVVSSLSSVALPALMRSLASTLGPAMALKAGLVGLAIGGIALLFTKIYQAMPGMEKYRDLLEKIRADAEALSEEEGRAHSDILRRAGEMDNAAERQEFLNEQIRLAQEELGRTTDQIEIYKNSIAEFYDLDLFDGKHALFDYEQLTAQEELLKAAEERINQLSEAIADMQQESVAAGREVERMNAALANAPLAKAGNTGFANKPALSEGFATDENSRANYGLRPVTEAEEKIAEMVRSAIVTGIERSAPGFSRLHELVTTAGVTANDIATYAMNAIPDVSAQQVQSLTDELGALTPEQRLDHELVEQIVAGWLSGLEEMRVATEAQRENAGIAAEGFGEFARRLTDLHREGELGTQAVTSLGQQAATLRDQLAGGQISADQFADAMRRLTDATDEAVEAAEREEMQRRRAALLRGDWRGAGLDFQQAMEDRMASFRMQQFNQQVESAFNGLMGFNEGLQGAVDGFDRMQNQVNVFGNTIVNYANGLADNAGEAFSTIAGFLSSREGQISALQNQIAQLLQNINMFGDDVGARRLMEWQDQMAALQGELDRLMNAPPVLSAPTLGDSAPTDPGLQQQSGTTTINLSLPNIHRLTNTDVATLYDGLQREAARRGRPALAGA